MSDTEREMLSRAARELLQEGEAKALVRILERRFRPLPADVLRRIASAGPEEVETWLDRVVDAATLDGVFYEPAKH